MYAINLIATTKKITKNMLKKSLSISNVIQEDIYLVQNKAGKKE